MWAIFDIVARHDRVDQRVSLPRFRMPAALDGSFAGDGVQQIIPEGHGIRIPAGRENCSKLYQTFFCVFCINISGNLPDQHGAIAEIFNFIAKIPQQGCF